MAVYVDEAKWNWRGKTWCHLVADSLDELHAFAGRIGLKRAWFQYPKTAYPHYDLTENRRKRAVELGAIEITSRELVEKSKALRPPNWKLERWEWFYLGGGTPPA